MEKEGTRPRGKEGDKLQTWEIRFVDKERKRETERTPPQRERKREGRKGCCSLARLTKRLFPHPALIPKLNHSAENQACSRFMQINDTLQRVNVPRYFITMGARARARMHHKQKRLEHALEEGGRGEGSTDEVTEDGSWEFLQITRKPSGKITHPIWEHLWWMEVDNVTLMKGAGRYWYFGPPFFLLSFSV